MSLKSKIIDYLSNIMVSHIQRYNHNLYWKRRTLVVDPNSSTPFLLKAYYFFYIKKCDAFNCASMGTNIGSGAHFSTPPILHHGINGIIISHKATIGSNCMIFQQVTMAERGGLGPTIGDNCFIGAGAKIIGGVTIGDNVKIGANAVVTKDIPSNCSAVGVPAKVVKIKSQK